MQVTVLSAASTVTKMGEIIVSAVMEPMFYQRKQPFNKYSKDMCLLCVGRNACKVKLRILRMHTLGD